MVIVGNNLALMIIVTADYVSSIVYCQVLSSSHIIVPARQNIYPSFQMTPCLSETEKQKESSQISIVS